MPETMTADAIQIEYRLNLAARSHECPVCGSRFESRLGMWPFAAGTDSAVCGAPSCPVGEEVAGPAPCGTRFRFSPLSDATLQRIQAATGSVAERFRLTALDEELPQRDRILLQCAAIDLQFCEADQTVIEEVEPDLVLRTCGAAAAELLLSGCGEPA